MGRKITDLVPEILLLEKISPSLYAGLQALYSLDSIFGENVKYRSEYEEGFKEILLMIVVNYDLLADEPKNLDLMDMLNYIIAIMNRRDFHAAKVDDVLPETANKMYYLKFNEEDAKFFIRVGEVMSMCNGELYLLLNEFGDVVAASNNQHAFFVSIEFARITVAILNSLIVTYAILITKDTDEKSRWIKLEGIV